MVTRPWEDAELMVVWDDVLEALEGWDEEGVRPDCIYLTDEDWAAIENYCGHPIRNASMFGVPVKRVRR